jgi:hypothetical protein
LELVEQKISDLQAARWAAEDENDWARADELWEEARKIRGQLTDAKQLAALSPEHRAEELAWRKEFVAKCEACLQRGEQWYFEGLNMVIVVPEEELDVEACRAARLAHRARPGPHISDDQLLNAAYVFARRFIKGATDRGGTMGKAIREILYFAGLLTPEGPEWKERWADAVREISQQNRREFLEMLARWRPDPPSSQVKCPPPDPNRPRLKSRTGKEMDEASHTDIGIEERP